MQQVIALIGDIVASKELPQRGVVQKRLAAALASVNASAQALASPYTLTLGDEFQSVYRRADSLFADMITIMAEIHPVRIRFAVGVGPLTTRINPTQALGMDGPAFHRARETLMALKDDERLVRIGGDGDWVLSNHVLNLVSHQIDRWEQNRLLILAGLLRGRKVREIEGDLPVSMVAVYKNIRMAALEDVVGVCRQIALALNESLAGQ